MSGDPTALSGLLVLDEEQAQFRRMAREVVDKEAPLSRFRAMRDRAETSDAALWNTFSALGWPAVMFAEPSGGLGLSLVEACQLTEALGRNLAPTPLLSTLMAGSLDEAAGMQQGRVVALAWQEQARNPAANAVTARVAGGRLTGDKISVLDATVSEAFVVSAVDGDHIRMFRVERAHAEVEPLLRLDFRDAANVRFSSAPAEPLPGGLPELQNALEIGTIALSAEMLGSAEACLERTLAWLHEREQFDVPLGSFQVLQHRAVDLFVGIELARSAVMAAAAAHATGQPAAALASLAKCRISESFFAVAKEAIQMHGGIGMTDECDIGFFLKRAAVAAETLGNAAWHRSRWADLAGY